MTAKKTKLNHIPNFKSIKEEAKFWDTHDTTDFEHEFKPARTHFAKKLEHILAVRLDSETLSKLEKEAAKKGVGPTTLMRMWTKERLWA